MDCGMTMTPTVKPATRSALKPGLSVAGSHVITGKVRSAQAAKPSQKDLGLSSWPPPSSEAVTLLQAAPTPPGRASGSGRSWSLMASPRLASTDSVGSSITYVVSSSSASGASTSLSSTPSAPWAVRAWSATYCMLESALVRVSGCAALRASCDQALEAGCWVLPAALGRPVRSGARSRKLQRGRDGRMAALRDATCCLMPPVPLPV
mmetsp:Transcript_11905/g.35483  ORF Transcript_11905/g.35483 Transcript_11905/m.35483 type:complete len:207 (-) Transcript_11905:15-635(-)